MELIQDKNSRVGLIGTIVFHALLLLFLLFFGLTYFDPPPSEEGITINFGTSDNGMGNEQIQATNTPIETVSQDHSEVQEATSSEDIVTQNTTETIAVNAKENTEKAEKVSPPKEEKKISNDLSAALSALDNAKQNTANSEGETNSPDDQGAIDGDVNSSKYTGGGRGSGITYSLAGRSLRTTPKIKDNSQEEGKVVVDIVVDKYGKVVKAIAGARGSTTSNSTLLNKAKEAALKTRFNAKPDAVSDQKGKMTFVFILN